MPDINKTDLVARLRDLNPWKDLDWPETARGAADALETQAAEISRLRDALSDVLGCTHKPNPTDPTRIDIAPGKHRKFGDAIRRARTALEANHGRS